MRKSIYIIFSILIVLMTTSCIKYSVNIDFSAKGSSSIKYYFTFSKFFSGLADSALIKNNINKDSVEVIEDSMNVTIVKTRKFSAKECEKVSMKFLRDKDGYTLTYAPGDISKEMKINNFSDTLALLDYFTYDVSMRIRDGKIISHNGDSIKDNVVYKTFSFADFESGRQLTVHVKTMNYSMIILLIAAVGILLAFAVIYTYLRSRNNEME